MSSSSRAAAAFPNVPAPPGSRAGTAYTRFIPREELGDFACWAPRALATARSAPLPAAPATAPAGSTTGGADPGTEEWRKRIAAARQLGYQEGYRDGLVALESFKQSFAQQTTAQAGALLDALAAQMDALDAQLAQAVTAAAVALARQVLRTELHTRPELVAQVASEALGNLTLAARHVTVHVNPLDLPLVAHGAAEALGARGARLHADAGVARGGVLVHSEVGAIDARIAQRWAQAVGGLGSDEPLDAPPDPGTPT